MQKTVNIFWCLLFLNLVGLPAFAQSVLATVPSSINGKTVSFTEFIDAMIAGNDIQLPNNQPFEYVIKDVTVKFVREIDKGKNGMDSRFGDANCKPIYIKSNLRIANISFDPEFWFVPHKLVFEGTFWVTNTEHLQGLFKNCTFKKSIAFFTNNTDFIKFENCIFEHGFRYVRGVVTDYIKFENCLFQINDGILDAITKQNFGMDIRPLLIDNKVQNMDLTLQNCTFNIADSIRHKPQFYIALKNSIFSNLRIINTTVNGSVDLENTTISNNFQLSKSKISDNIFVFGININPLGTRLEWELISQKLSIYDHSKGQYYNYSHIQTIPIDVFNDMFSTYSVIYSAFKTQGNRYSTNQCYIEWKNLETAYLKKLYQKDNEFGVYFTYLMNVFLSIFCDYGTNPLKSLYISFYVMLAFAVLYFFLPHNFGHQQSSFFGSLTDYILTIHTIGDIRQTIIEAKQTYLNETSQVKRYFDTIRETRKPFYYYLIAFPDLVRYYISRTILLNYFQVSLWSLQRIEKVNFVAILVIFMVVTAWVINRIIIRCLDCIALSMNIFTTLGFGSTEMIGVPMYLTVIEGFTGWLLLSFFSLSLISQLVN